MRNTWLILMLLFLPLLAVHAQEQKDSVVVSKENLPIEAAPVTGSFGGGFNETLPQTPYALPKAEIALPKASDGYSLPNALRRDTLPHFSLRDALYPPYLTNPSPMHRGDYHTGGIIRSLQTGAFYGKGSQESLPGVGLFNSATLGYRQRLGDKLSLNFSLDATKMTMTHLTGQMFSTSGSLNYQVSDKLSISAFGTYALGNGYGMNTHSYGAAALIGITENFHMQVGVQRHYNMYTGRWETVPIAMPILKIGEAAIGFDVGALLHQLLKENVFKKQFNGGLPRNPTIAPVRPYFPTRMR